MSAQVLRMLARAPDTAPTSCLAPVLPNGDAGVGDQGGEGEGGCPGGVFEEEVDTVVSSRFEQHGVLAGGLVEQDADHLLL
jgi:hypothetical protein